MTAVANGDPVTKNWDELADTLGAVPFVRPGWITAWWRAFGRGRLEILTNGRGDAFDAVLPIADRFGAAVSPCNWHTPEFRLLHKEDAAGAGVLTQLFDRGPRLVSLRFLPRVPQDLDLLTATADAAGYRVVVRTMARFPWVQIEGDWSPYERTLSRNLRRDVARCQRGIHRLGEVKLDVTNTPDALAEAFAIERSGWKGARKTAMSSRSATAQFYADIARWAADRESLRLIFLRVDSRAVAFHLAIEEGGAYFPLKGGFDPAFRAYSPGKLVIRATLERAFAVGLKRYEFLGGEDAYKRRWATDTSDRLSFQAFGPTLRGHATRAAFKYGRPLAKRALASVGAMRSRDRIHPPFGA